MERLSSVDACEIQWEQHRSSLEVLSPVASFTRGQEGAWTLKEGPCGSLKGRGHGVPV